MAFLTKKPKVAKSPAGKAKKAASPIKPQSKGEIAKDPLQQMAKDHLWMHFARQSGMESGNGVPIIARGEGHHIL
jgi:hypothetical protein